MGIAKKRNGTCVAKIILKKSHIKITEYPIEEKISNVPFILFYRNVIMFRNESI